MKIALLSTFLVATISNAIATEYAFLQKFTSAGCNEDGATGYTYAYAVGVCFNKLIASVGPDGNNATLTQFEDSACTKAPKVLFSGEQNACGVYSSSSASKSAKFTATSPSYAQAKSTLATVIGSPLKVYYSSNDDCTTPGAPPDYMTSQTSDCVPAGNASQTQQCGDKDPGQGLVDYVTTCDYKTDNCQGESTCDKGNNRPNTKVCYAIANGNYARYDCTYATPTPKPKKPSNNPTPVSGGVVAAVIIVPLVIIIVAVLAYILIRKSKQGASPSDTMTGTGNTYGSV